ncbi:MAG: hypothetical protein MJB57_17835, partial [Gemmatimonadetes bacterium]|nr:hypothetical protein [Gemmatimonadota bacterium]
TRSSPLRGGASGTCRSDRDSRRAFGDAVIVDRHTIVPAGFRNGAWSRPRRRVRLVAPASAFVLAATLALPGCGADGGTGPRPPSVGSEWIVRLHSPFGREGAAAIELTGPTHEFEAQTGAIVVRRVAERVQVAAFRAGGGEISFTATSESGTPPAGARVLQVADERGELRSDVSGYAVTIEAIR